MRSMQTPVQIQPEAVALEVLAAADKRQRTPFAGLEPPATRLQQPPNLGSVPLMHEHIEVTARICGRSAVQPGLEFRPLQHESRDARHPQFRRNGSTLRLSPKRRGRETGPSPGGLDRRRRIWLRQGVGMSAGDGARSDMSG